MNPEEIVEIKLCDWLKSEGIHIRGIYFNRKNNLNLQIFHVKGNARKPDLLILTDRGFGDEYIAIEVKSSSEDRNVLDSGKIIDYYLNYAKEETKYYINGQEIKIRHFIVATENSINGFLFNDEKEIIDNNSGNDNGKIYASSNGLIPKKEFAITKRFLRNLWSQFSRLRAKINFDLKPSLGILTSDFYDKKKPYIAICAYIDYLDKKPKWGQRFIQI